MSFRNRLNYKVSGLQNTQIKTQVKNVLNEIEGVQKVNVDLARGSIEVGFNSATDENEIKEGIERVGCIIE